MHLKTKPCIILVKPQMGENIGAAARAMLNFGLTDLRLVRPRDGWPSAEAEAMSSGALEKMPPVRIYDSLAESLADIHLALATTARPRDMTKPVYTPKGAAELICDNGSAGMKCALVFGCERAGLDNEDVSLTHGIITIPTNPDFSSLNLAQSVLLLCSAAFAAQDETPNQALPMGGSEPATHEAIDNFFQRLENELESRNFFRAPEMQGLTMNNIRNFFLRAHPSDQEIRTLHGIVSALIGNKIK